MSRIDEVGNEVDRFVNRFVRYHYWLSYAEVQVMEQTAVGSRDGVERLKEEVRQKGYERIVYGWVCCIDMMRLVESFWRWGIEWRDIWGCLRREVSSRPPE